MTGVVLVDACGIEVPGHPVADFFSLSLDQVAELSYHDPAAFRIDPATMSPDALRAIFTRFIDERQQAAGGPPVPAQQKDDLFKEFQRWQSSQAR